MRMKEYDKDLEEAAREFATQTMPFTDETYVDEGAYHGFIAGAKWQKEKKEAEHSHKGVRREKTAYVNGQGVETR